MTRPLFPHPPGWAVCTLEPDPAGDVVVEAASGSTPRTADASCWGGTIPWLTPKEVTDSSATRYVASTERAITERGLAEAGRLWPPGTVMLTKRAPVGFPVINTVPMATNQGFLNFRCGKKLVPEFLYYWLTASTAYLDAVANGSTYPELYVNDLFEFEIAIPPLPQQQAIAEMLGALDDQIELDRHISVTLETMTRALFKSWFVDFDPVRAKMEGRPPVGMDNATAELFPDDFEDSALGKIPRGWRVGRLSDLCSTQYGYTASGIDEALGPKLLRVTDINKQDWIEWDEVPYCVIDDREKSKYALELGDVVVARMADPGKSAIVDDPVDAVFASYLVRLKTRSLACSYYIYSFLKSSAYEDYAAGAVGGSVQANMNAKVIVAAELAIPPDDILEAFCSLVGPARERIAVGVRQSSTLASLRDALLPRFLSGGFRPSDADKVVATAT